MDWHSLGCSLPVFDETRLTPRQNEVFASAQWSRRNRNLAGQMTVPMSAATGSPCPIRGRVQSATGPCPHPVRDLNQSVTVAATCPWTVRGCHHAKVGTVPRTGNANRRELSAASPQSRGVVRVNQRRDCMSPVVASMSCSPHPAALHIAPAARLREFCLYDSALGDLFCEKGQNHVRSVFSTTPCRNPAIVFAAPHLPACTSAPNA